MSNNTTKETSQLGNKDLLPIVGIGASAGGLKALKNFFNHVPNDSGLAYVVVVHLSPEHKSALAELLQKHVKMPVVQVTETVALKPNNVYVIPPNANLNTIDTHLRLSELEEKRSERAPIDHFFRTLAQTHNRNSACIILTGTGSDGTLGLKEIKEKGGLTIVQDPEEAEFTGMPLSALSTGLVDMVLPLKEMPGNFIKFFTTKPRLPSLQKGKKTDQQENQLIQKIFAQLKARTGRDFSRYKLSTMLRRLQRRMQIYNIESLPDYLELMRKNGEEVKALSDDFLINVTNFFRDPGVFEYLKESVFPSVFENKRKNEQVRVWSVGCATGEEAYSLAILLTEAADKFNLKSNIQIFASDLHDDSLKKAREGYYPGDIKTDVNDERLTRFFSKEDNGYRVRKELREKVIFTPHNVMADPPFSRLDIIVCRNLLIYLKRELQRDLYELFHYALLPDGFLVLGNSEHLESSELFKVQNKDHVVYRKKNVAGPEPRLPVFPRMQNHFNEEPEIHHKPKPESFGALHHKMIERYAPPSILLSPDYQVLHVSETAGRYLSFAGGEITKDVFKLVRPELHMELRSTIFSARERKKMTRSKPLQLNMDGALKQVFISVRIVHEPEGEHVTLVLFEEYDDPKYNEQAREIHKEEKVDMSRVRELEEELNETRERLQSIIEEYETSREEMKASNEELQSANEELRSTMEELETSKEELQSLNEELTTVNQENRHKVEELSQLSDDLQNLLESTEIATLFLDRNLRIMRFTPKLSQLFNVRQEDKGRPVSDQTHNLNYYKLIEDIKSVLATLVPVEKEIDDKEGKSYITNIRPYRTGEDRIEGVVLTFVDITSRKQVEKELKIAKEYAEKIIETLHEPLLVMYPNLTIKSANQSFYNHFKVTPEETLGKRIYDLGNGQWNIPKLRELMDEILPRNNVFNDYEVQHNFQNIGFKTMLLNGRRLDNVQLILLGIRDVSEQKKSEDALKSAKQQAEHSAVAKEEFLAHMSHEIRTPLNAITGLAHLLLKQNPKKSQLNNLNTLKIASESLGHIINDILDFSKIKSGKVVLDEDTIHLRKTLKNILQVHQIMADNKGIRLEFHVDKKVPEYIVTDEMKLSQILNNLLSNAVKFTPKGKVSLVVKLHKKETQSLWLYIEVNDTGIGIPQDKLENIFDVFSQADSSTIRQYGGTGLGLTITKLYLEILSSEIHAESEQGKGSRFYFILPVKEGNKEKQDQPSYYDKSMAEDRLKSIHILHAEDTEFNRMILAQYFDIWETRFGEAENGREAVEMAKKEAYDIILMDVRMPEMDGYEASREIRKLPGYEHVPIIALTADVSSKVKREVSSGLFTDIVLKPVSPEDLSKKLLEHLT